MEDIITAKVNYEALDDYQSPAKIRLNSTVINVTHSTKQKIQTSYVNNGKAYSIRSKNVILACWHSVIPYICKDLPDQQKTALSSGVKAPLVYTNIFLSNWRSFVKSGVSQISAPGSFHSNIGLPASLNFGNYQTSRNPDNPIVLRMAKYYVAAGLSSRDQHRVGRNELLNTSFSTFEENIRDQMARMLGSDGFNEEDILGITVNRWPHGYTYTYNSLFDPEDWAYTSTTERPAVKARKKFGQIAIANADAAASPHTDAAINEAYRAVIELSKR